MAWSVSLALYHYTNLTFVCDVCESGRSREGHLTRAKNFSFSSSLDLDVTCSSSLTQLAMVLAATKVSRFKRTAGQTNEIRELLLSMGAFQKAAILF